MFTGLLQAAGVRCSMDGRGRCPDNVFIKRLWRSLEVRSGLPAPVGGRLHGATGDRRVVEFSNEGATALGTGWSDAGGRLPPGRGARTADGAADMGSRWQLRVPRAEDQREHNPARGVIHNVHRIKPPSPAPLPPFTATCF